MHTRRLTRDGSYTLYSNQYKQTFHSVHGSKTEAIHVFLNGTDISKKVKSQRQLNVLEIGFGTGFNFFLTADLVLQHERALSFWSLEKTLLDATIINSLDFGQWVAEAKLIEDFLVWRKMLPHHPNPGLLRWNYSDSLSLDLLLGEATEAHLKTSFFDAIYLDAFSPDQNPELWTISFLQKLFASLLPGARLATYSAKSVVRKNMIHAGFEVLKLPGPPGKREMLVGIRNS